MRKLRSEAEWCGLFGEQKRSGKTVREFCRIKGIHENVFYRKKTLLSGTGGLVRLPVKLERRGPIAITISGVTIDVATGFAERELVRVLRCVREALDA